MLWGTSELMIIEERTIAPVQDIQLWIAQQWVTMSIGGSISVTNELRPVYVLQYDCAVIASPGSLT